MVAISSSTPVMGYSFSPGGLSLEYHGHITDPAHLVGVSAGDIAVACHTALTPLACALEAVVRICNECETKFGGRAVGKLVPLLKDELEKCFVPEAYKVIN